MKKSKLVLFIVSVIAVVTSFLWYYHTPSLFVSIPVTYDKYHLPFIDMKIGEEVHSVAVIIGSTFPLVLKEDVLAKLDKTSHGTRKRREFVRGEYSVCTAPLYLIPKIQIGDLTVTDIVAAQVSTDNEIGGFLGGEHNCMLDFLNSRIIVCDSFSTLKAKGLVNDHWIKVPFQEGRVGLMFRVRTDLGWCNLSLNTNANVSFLRSSFSPSKETVISTTFCLGEKDFGKTVLRVIDFPDDVHEMDGSIGMDFLQKRAIYLDRAHKMAYIEPDRVYFEKLPITFSEGDTPRTDISIEGNLYPIEIDLGINTLLTLKEDILLNVHKVPYGTAKWTDFMDNYYESPSYIIPELQVGGLTFFNAVARQDQEDFHVNTNLSGIPFQPFCVIGRSVLEKYNLFLDFKNAAMYACDSLDHLQKKGLFSEHFLRIPFSLDREGILLSVETDMGNLRLVLDTGATYTFIRAPCPTNTEKFCLAGHDFGMHTLTPLDLHPSWGCDGLLGMDFLFKHSLFIDYDNRVIFLELDQTKKAKD